MKRSTTLVALAILTGLSACPARQPPSEATLSGGMAEAQDSDRAREIIATFYQDGGSNCASIGVIKAALDHYRGSELGEHVFRSRSRDPVTGEIAIVTRTGEAVTVTPADLEFVRSDDGAQFGVDEESPVGKRAYEMYAVMVHRLQASDPAKYKTFAKAAARLNNGAHFTETPALLGLPRSEYDMIGGWWPRTCSMFDFVEKYDTCVAADPWHAWYVAQGWADKYGEAVDFTSRFSSFLGFRATNAYCFKAPSDLPNRDR